MKFLTEGLMHLTSGFATAKFGRRIASNKTNSTYQEKVFPKLFAGLVGTR